jgi:hypothetical protein
MDLEGFIRSQLWIKNKQIEAQITCVMRKQHVKAKIKWLSTYNKPLSMVDFAIL